MWTKITNEQRKDFEELGELGGEAYFFWNQIKDKVYFNGALDPVAIDWILDKYHTPSEKELLLIKRIEAIHNKVREIEERESNQDNPGGNKGKTVH